MIGALAARNNLRVKMSGSQWGATRNLFKEDKVSCSAIYHYSKSNMLWRGQTYINAVAIFKPQR